MSVSTLRAGWTVEIKCLECEQLCSSVEVENEIMEMPNDGVFKQFGLTGRKFVTCHPCGHNSGAHLFHGDGKTQELRPIPEFPKTPKAKAPAERPKRKTKAKK